MFGGFGNIVEILKNAKDIQARVAQMQNQLAAKRFEAETGGGAVRIVVDGKGSVVDVKIDPTATADVELLEELVKSAVRSASLRAQDAMKEEFSKITGGLSIPGLDDMLTG